MRTIVTIILIILSTFSLFAQEEKLEHIDHEIDSLYKQKKYEEATQKTLQYISLAKETHGIHHEKHADGLVTLAVLHYMQKKFTEGDKYFDQSFNIFKKRIKDLTLHELTTEEFTQKTTTYGSYEEMKSHLNNSYIYNGKLRQAVIMYGDAIGSLGEVYQIFNNYIQAEEKLKESINILDSYKTDESSQKKVKFLISLATLYQNIGRHKEAEPHLIEAINIHKNNSVLRKSLYTKSLGELADLYKNMGRYAEAEALYKEMLNQGYENKRFEALSRNNLANLYTIMGRYKDAEPLYRQALTIKEEASGKESMSYAIGANSLATLLMKTMNYDEAESLYQESLHIVGNQKGEQHFSYAVALNNLAGLYQQKKQYNNTLSLLEQALDIAKQKVGTKHPTYAYFLHNIASANRELQQYDKAEQLYKQAVDIYKKTIGKDSPAYAKSISYLAKLYADMAQYEKANALYIESIQFKLKEFSKQLGHSSETEKRDFLKANKAFFHDFDNFFIAQSSQLSDTLLKARYDIQLANKGLLMNSSKNIRQRILNSQDSILIKQFETWQQLREQIAFVSNLSERNRKKRGLNIDTMKRSVNSIEKEISARSEDFKLAEEEKKASWLDIQRNLSKDEVAIEIIKMPYRFDISDSWNSAYVALIVTPDATRPESIAILDGDRLEKECFIEYKFQCLARSSASSEGILEDSDLYNDYWRPIWQKVQALNPKAKRVYIATDGIYNQINLSMLQNLHTHKYVLEEVDLHPLTSTADIIKIKQQHKRQQKGKYTATLVGNPTYLLNNSDLDTLIVPTTDRSSMTTMGMWRFTTFTDLPETQTEINVIKKLLSGRKNWKVKSFSKNNALEENIKSLKSPTLLHIATHGFFLENHSEDTDIDITDAMLRSGLVLAGAETYLLKPDHDAEDGLLTAYEAMHLDLSSTELVVLSACETGVGDLEAGEGVYGLQRGLMIAGAKTVMMSMWQVDDQATKELMTHFYTRWAKTGDKRTSFREAQLELKKKYKAPFYWGAFVMVGE